MSKNLRIEEIENQFISIAPLCEGLVVELERQIGAIIKNENIPLAVPIQYRAKKWHSIQDKLNQGRFTVKKSIFEIQDLVGVRVILLFKRDVDRIAELIRRSFNLYKEYHTQDKLEEDQFGYSSIHQIISLPDDWLKTPTFRGYKDFKAEIQIRTLSQHAWAEASNIFQYKNETNVPKPLKRTISRISALLETVDLEFERTLLERDAYKSEINVQDVSNTEAQILNVDLLEHIITHKLPIRNRIVGNDLSKLLNDLISLDIKTTQDLNKLIDTHLNTALNDEKSICNEMMESWKLNNWLKASNPYNINANYAANAKSLGKIKSGYFFSAGGLIRHLLSISLQRDYSDVIDEKKKHK